MENSSCHVRKKKNLLKFLVLIFVCRYGENSEVVKPEQLLADIATFVSAFNAVRKELTMTSASSTNATAVKRVEEKVDTVDAVGSNDVDELKSQLASGQAFEARREQRRVARGQTIRGKNAF